MTFREVENGVVEIMLQILMLPLYAAGYIVPIIGLLELLGQGYRAGFIYLFCGLSAYALARAITKLHDARGYVMTPGDRDQR